MCLHVSKTDMNTGRQKRYESPLRRAQAEATRGLILGAAGALLERGGEEALNYGAVAREAGVQERTVYRHFPTRDALLDAFWVWINARAGFTAFPEDERDLVEQPRAVFAGFDRVEGIVRSSLSSRHGRELRLRVNEERRAAFRRCLAEATRGLDPSLARRAEAVVQLLYSASAWQTMKDYWDMTGEEAGEAASWAIRTILDALRREATKAKGEGE